MAPAELDVTLEQIFVYPVKSARGVSLEEARVGARGIELDRRFMVVGPQGEFITQRQVPRMALVTVAIEKDALVLGAPGAASLRVPRAPEGPLRRVRVWSDTCDAVSAGADAEGFFSELLGLPAALVFMPESTRRPVAGHAPRLVGFADAFPLLVISRASLDALNEQLDTPVGFDRFRPNLVVSGGAAHDEDRWRELAFGSLVFSPAGPCGRCVMVDIDPATATRTGEPLATLARYRRSGKKVLFGQNLVHEGEGTLRVGDVGRASAAP